MTIPVLRLAVGAFALSMTAALHAATPISLPLGDLGLSAALELPVPPPPQASKPDVTRMRLIIKMQPRGNCSGAETRRPVDDRWQVAAQSDPWATKPASSPLG